MILQNIYKKSKNDPFVYASIGSANFASKAILADTDTSDAMGYELLSYDIVTYLI